MNGVNDLKSQGTLKFWYVPAALILIVLFNYLAKILIYMSRFPENYFYTPNE